MMPGNETPNRPAAQRGFTLVEVMVALSILAVALVGLIARTANNIRMTQEMGMLDVATDLARSKMYDVEAEILKDGFPELDKELDGDFGDEGWPGIRWQATIEKVELPNLTALEAMQGGEGGEAGKAAGGGALGGLLGMAGGGEGGSFGDMAFLTSQFELISQVLEVSIRKVTLKVMWSVGNEDKDMVVSCYFTDPQAMGKVIGGLGAGMPDSGGGADPGAGNAGGGNDNAPGFGRGNGGRGGASK